MGTPNAVAVVAVVARETLAGMIERVGRGWALMGMSCFVAADRMRRKARAG